MKAALRKQGWRPTEVHPVAALFPMMSDDELADLAADIKANGLNYPIVVDDDGVLIDGRNRLEACKLAGVEPHYEGLNGRKPEALIVSANLARRNLTKGQQAMALAMIYPEPAKLKRKGGSSVSEDQGVSVTRLSNARAVLRHSRALAEEVLRGGKSLDAALVKMAEDQAETAQMSP
jgi:hypothetical protein